MDIKICGLMRPDDVDSVNLAGPDYAGFIIDVPGSRRTLSPDRAAALSRQLAESIRAVGVFVDADPQLPTRLWDEGVIDVIQLHGQEDDWSIQSLQNGPGGRHRIVWKAFQIRGPEDVAAANASSADLVVLDSGQGSGLPFDWTLLRAVERPYMLAGGLDAGRIAQARMLPLLLGVDLSSGVETRGHKDRVKIRAAVAAAHKE